MKIVKRNNEKYPYKVICSNKKSLIIPKQQKFSNAWLRAHGCSLVAEYIALQWGGVKKSIAWLLDWHKKNTPSQVKSKVTVKGVSQGINEIAGKKLKATYYREVTLDRLRAALDKGYLVIMEQKNPIHSVVLLPDTDGVFVASNGTVKRELIAKVAERATTNDKYRGMVVVREK